MPHGTCPQAASEQTTGSLGCTVSMTIPPSLYHVDAPPLHCVSTHAPPTVLLCQKPAPSSLHHVSPLLHCAHMHLPTPICTLSPCSPRLTFSSLLCTMLQCSAPSPEAESWCTHGTQAGENLISQLQLCSCRADTGRFFSPSTSSATTELGLAEKYLPAWAPNSEPGLGDKDLPPQAPGS